MKLKSYGDDRIISSANNPVDIVRTIFYVGVVGATTRVLCSGAKYNVSTGEYILPAHNYIRISGDFSDIHRLISEQQ
jgi:hypothetical protein